MLGSGKSSLAQWTTFDTEATADVRHPVHNLKIAWTRVKNDSLAFATIDSSMVGGIDIIQGQLTDITEPDKFQYFDETERAMELSYDRQLEEPLGGFIFTLGDVILENTTKRFTWGVSDTIGTALKPRRPLKMFMGFRISGADRFLPVLYGLTDQPQEDKAIDMVKLGVFDYVTYVNDYELESDTIFTDQRSDQIINDILTTVGFVPTQFSLDTGLNTIGFAWFPKGTKAGVAIRQIIEAEEGQFYQDEEGLLRFDNRRKYLTKNTNTWTINPEDIIEWREDTSVQVINRCFVKAKPRSVQSNVEVWRSGVVVELQNNEVQDIWATFEDPVTATTSPAATIDYIANTASDGSGTNVTGDIGVSISKFVRSAKLTVTNNAGLPIFLTLLRLRGTPATVTSEINELYEDTDSEENYGRQQLVIENDFIDSESFAYYLARTIVRKYKDPLRRIIVTIPGHAGLQIKDRVAVNDVDTGAYKNYRIMRIQGKMSPTFFTQTLTLREVTDLESDTAAIVDSSTVDGEDVIWV